MAASILGNGNYTASLILTNFSISYLFLSSRTPKQAIGIDHNVAPRGDLSKYGEEAVKKGKCTRQGLERIQRLEAAHANAVEHFPFFVGSLLFANMAKLPSETINTVGAIYTLARIGYAFAYVYIESHQMSYIRSVLWWVGNISCIYTVVQAGKAINA